MWYALNYHALLVCSVNYLYTLTCHNERSQFSIICSYILYKWEVMCDVVLSRPEGNTPDDVRSRSPVDTPTATFGIQTVDTASVGSPGSLALLELPEPLLCLCPLLVFFPSLLGDNSDG